MRIPDTHPTDEPDNILPLINVVFLLLIFFMLTGALHAIDYFNVDPPVSARSDPSSLEDTIILIAADGRLAIDNEEVDAIDLQLAVSDKLAEQADTVVRIKADGRVDATRVVEVMELVEQVGVRGVTLLTLEPEQ